MFFGKKVGLAVLGIAMSTGIAYANEQELRLGPVQEPLVTVHAQFVGYCQKVGSYGYVTGRAKNHTAQSHVVHLALQVSPSEASARTDVNVAANGQQAFVLPWPCLEQDLPFLRAELNGTEVSASASLQESFSRQSNTSVLRVSEQQRTTTRDSMLASSLGAPSPNVEETPEKPNEKIFHQWIHPQQLPEQWFLLTGFDAIIMDGSYSHWTEDQHKLLQDYTRAGGFVMVTQAHSLPEKWLLSWQRHALENAEISNKQKDDRSSCIEKGIWGHGAFVLDVGPLCNNKNPQKDISFTILWIQQQLHKSTNIGISAPSKRNHVEFTGLPPQSWFQGLTVQGLKQVPLVGFVVALVLFALLMGPLNYWYWYRRRKKPVMVLVSIPVMGLLFTTGLLAYGLFSEGLGIRGSIVSFTWADQRNQEAVTTATRTLYAATSSASLVINPTTYVLPIELLAQKDFASPASPYRWDFRTTPKGLEVEGSALPARTPISLTTQTVHKTPIELEFRPQGKDSLVLASSRTEVPLRGVHSLLLRDFTGHYYAQSPGETHLRLIPTQEEQNALLAHWSRQEAIQRQQAFWNRWTREGRELPVGSYVASMKENAFIDTLGLSVQYANQEHIICGHLAPENIHD